MIGQNIIQFIQSKERQNFQKHLVSLTRKNPIATANYPVTTPTGDIYWLQCIHRLLFSAPGRIKVYQSVARDITEQLLLEQSLLESEQRFRIFADFTCDWEYWIAPDGNYIFVSPSCERITGYPADEFYKDSGLFEKIVHPDDRAMVAEHLKKSKKKERF